KPPLYFFLSQFKDFMILILIAAAIISGIVGDKADTLIILVIVFLNAIVGLVQEYKAEKAMEALRKMAASHATVIRQGVTLIIPSDQVVPGDIVLLEAGNTIPADMRLLETHSLRIMESSLTGESVPVDKITKVISKKEVSLGDQYNMAFKGTQVANGRGRGVVVATGMNTEIGKIAKMLKGKELPTPLQLRMADFGKKLSYLILLICIILFVVGFLRGEEPIRMLLVAISLAVAAIPEALPALITIALSRGAKRLVHNNVLIRKLAAVETLGSVTYICSDKTGTLTQNSMTVVEVSSFSNVHLGREYLPLLNVAIALNHDVRITSQGEFLGDPTEVALIKYFKHQYSADDYNSIHVQFPRVSELPFDSDRKCMTTIHSFGNQFLVICKGAVEAISKRMEMHHQQNYYLSQANQMAAKGVRVLCYGYRVMDAFSEPFDYDLIEKDLLMAGIIGLIDPPREEIPAAIRECYNAGMVPVMITGDHKETAVAIARGIGIHTGEDKVMTGEELSRLHEKEFEQRVENVTVYARVSPEQKLKIVKALQQRSHFVAMTGDGVNDAPSLKKANIGIAMGISGTDVSKEAADMILLDDNFASIVKAVKEGRRIYDNIRRFVKYIMTCNGAEIWTIFLAPLFGLPIPLLPIHILWINLVTDGLPGLALSSEKAERNIMHRPPRPTNESLFAEGITRHIIWVGLLMAFITLGIQAWALHQQNTHWQTMVFTVLSLAQLAHVFAIRSDNEFIYNKGIFSNKVLAWVLALTFILQMAVIYLPAANNIFKTQPLSFQELLICIVSAALIFHAVEAEKWLKQKRYVT
ncbi:MAG TPA: cation-translocating P-type ATPase, partial [Flavisolibacter sp.]|nr:cation-translocating P-type ATPase [Flavisolibacter sp.]